MNDYDALYPQLAAMGLLQWVSVLKPLVESRLASDAHGKMPIWQTALAALPDWKAADVDLVSGVRIGDKQ